MGEVLEKAACVCWASGHLRPCSPGCPRWAVRTGGHPALLEVREVLDTAAAHRSPRGSLGSGSGRMAQTCACPVLCAVAAGTHSRVLSGAMQVASARPRSPGSP